MHHCLKGSQCGYAYMECSGHHSLRHASVFKGATHKDASWPYNAGFTWLSCQYWCKRGPFYKFQLLVTQPQSLYRVCNTFHQWKAKAGWLVTWYILMQYKLILFMMSHTQNTRHKKALLMAMIVLLKTISFEQTKPHRTEKNAVNEFFIPLLSTGPVVILCLGFPL